MERRDVLKTMAIAGLAAGASGTAAKAQTAAQTFVLVHGAWHGGWCWSRVADRLRSAGHLVFTPTQTGLGDRKHLLSKDITLDTFTKDIANLIEAEELSNIVLVGHSFGGLAISGVADAMPDRIRHLVYLDSLIVEGGKKPFDILPPDVVAARLKAAEESLWRFRRQGYRLGQAPADAASARHLHQHAQYRGPGRQQFAAHLYPLHRSVLRGAASLARLGQGAAGLALGRHRHRPRRHGDGARRTDANADRRVELKNMSSRPPRRDPYAVSCR
jgi:pimeloyl-ACP methyl ester carboxylesterase